MREGPQLTEAEHYQDEGWQGDKPSPVVFWTAISFLAAPVILAVAVAWQQGWV